MTSQPSDNSPNNPVPSADTSAPEERGLMPTSAELEATPEAFAATEFNPTPVPGLSSLEPDPWDFLQYIDPIEDPGMLAFQVGQLTVGMSELLTIIADLQTQVNELKGQTDELPDATHDVGGPDLGNG